MRSHCQVRTISVGEITPEVYYIRSDFCVWIGWLLLHTKLPIAHCDFSAGEIEKKESSKQWSRHYRQRYVVVNFSHVISPLNSLLSPIEQVTGGGINNVACLRTCWGKFTPLQAHTAAAAYGEQTHFTRITL